MEVEYGLWNVDHAFPSRVVCLVVILVGVRSEAEDND